MKSFFFSLLVILLSACSLMPGASPSPAPSATLSIPWMGVTPPGETPSRFASGSFHSAATFSPDGRTVYWGGEYGLAKIYTSQLVSGEWTTPSIITFSETMNSYRDPFFSPDGLRLYFISEDPHPGSPSSKENIWMMEKEGEGWGVPVPLPESVNALSLHWTVSVAANYNLYYSAGPEGEKDILLSRYINGQYTEPISLSPLINSEGLEITPNIAPDESYLLFTRLRDRNSPPHLYISYALPTGWSEAQRVENIEYCISPIITPDRNYVIYMSSPFTMDWRDTTFIEELRPR